MTSTSSSSTSISYCAWGDSQTKLLYSEYPYDCQAARIVQRLLAKGFGGGEVPSLHHRFLLPPPHPTVYTFQPKGSPRFYLCVAPSSFPSLPCHGLLEEMANEGTKGTPTSGILSSMMSQWSDGSKTTDPKIQALRKTLDETQETLIQSIDLLLQRGEKIEVLVDKAASLNESSHLFLKQSTAVKRMMCCKSVKATIGLVFLILVILGILALVLWLNFR